MKSFLKTLLILGSVASVEGAKWDYKKNGADWKDVVVDGNLCGTGKNQSPIDLKTSGWPLKASNFDNFNKIYTDQEVEVAVTWNGHTSQVAINKPGQSVQTLYSEHASDGHKAGTTYNGVQFHFHAGSEHTVDGVRQDIEMHTVHLPVGDSKSGFMAAAMGIMFSVDKPTPGVSASDVAIIDEFFEALQWDKTSAKDSETAPLVEKVPYGKLMMMFDMRNRWTYKGSVTTPPCAQNVYWNVLKTIYPIKQKHVDMFKTQLDKVAGLKDTGNWRVTLPLTDDHNPIVLFANEGVGGPTNAAAAAAKTSGSASTSASASGTAASSGGVTLKQQGTIIVQHQGYLSSGAPYPMPQQYYQPPVIQQAAAPAAAPVGSRTVEIPSDFRVVIIFLAVAVFLLILVIVIGIFCQQFGRQQQYMSADSKGYATQEMGQRNFN